jgi:hypothetical protein
LSSGTAHPYGINGSIKRYTPAIYYELADSLKNNIFARRKNKFPMKKLFFVPLLSLFPLFSFAQSTPPPCSINGSRQTLLKQNSVLEQWEYKADKKTRKRSLNSFYEYDDNGCAVKRIVPDKNNTGTYSLNEWKYDDSGRMTNYKEGKIDADSAKSYAFSESYHYNSTGLLSAYRKDIYEGEMSQTVEKWEYSYSANGEKTEISLSNIRVRKDTILNDDIKYSGNGNPIERTVNMYFPKGLSEFRKYSAGGLPAEFIRYEKGKMMEHKYFSYSYDKQGMLLEIVVNDGVAKTNERRKYEKDKITYTLMNTKGKILKTNSEPLAPPATLPYPPLPAADSKPIITEKETPDNTTTKEKLDKKKNKVVEHYSGSKLVYSEMFNSQGLLIEKNPSDAGFVLQYEYTFY